MKKEILLLLIFSFFIAGCSSKQPPIVFKPEVVCYKLEKVEIKPLECNEAKEISNDKTQFVVDESDKEVFLSRCNELKSAMTFYENQIEKVEIVGNNEFSEMTREINLVIDKFDRRFKDDMKVIGESVLVFDKLKINLNAKVHICQI